MQSDGVAASQIQRIALNAGLGQTAQLDAGTSGIGNGNGISADSSVHIGVVDVDTTGKTTDLIALDDQLVATLALSKYGVGVAVTAVIGSIKYIIMDIVGHPGISKIIVHIQTTAEHAVLDLHLAGSSLGTILCSVGRRSPHRGRIGICKLNIVNSQLRFLYKGIIIKHNKTEPTYTKTSLFLCEKRRFLWPGLRKEGNLFKLAGPGGLAFFHLTKKEVSKWPMKK